MLNLKNITLVLVDGVDPEVSLKTLIHCSRLANFEDILFFTFKDLRVPSKIKLNKIKKFDYVEYNHFIISDLNSHIKSDFCLIVQTDGFILNSEKWQDNFLNFDYIGAPWEQKLQDDYPLGTRVGNGGFSLRSKKFLETTSNFIISYGIMKEMGLNKNEDFFLCKTNYEELVSRGIKFADLKTAAEFSLESSIPEYPKKFGETFGFHGKNETTLKIMEKIKEINIC